MKKLLGSAAGAALLALAACNSPTEQAAENIEDAAENQADMYEAQADNATNEVVEDQLENQADQVEAAGERRADEVEDNDASDVNPADQSNVSGM